MDEPQKVKIGMLQSRGVSIPLLQHCGWVQKLTKNVKMVGSGPARVSLPRVRITSHRKMFSGVTSIEEYLFEMVFVGIGEGGLIPLHVLQKCGNQAQMFVLMSERSTAFFMYHLGRNLGSGKRKYLC